VSTDSHSKTARRARPGIGKTLLVCAALAVAGLLALWWIFTSEPQPQRESAVRETAMLVEVESVEAGAFRPLIRAMGTVRASREIELSPRIGGLVIELSPEAVPGGEVFAGDVLFRLDEADYRIALEQRRSDLLQAQAQLEIEFGRQEIAERDYRELQKDLEADNRALVLREPQLRSAQAEVRAAQAAVDQARLDLERTAVKAPFHAQVLSRSASAGSLVASGEPLARLVGLDRYWIEVAVPLDRLPWLEFAAPTDTGGSRVDVQHRSAWPQGSSRQGRLLRLVGELEGDTRMARMLVAVDDPLARTPQNAGEPGLIIGSFVECRIHGREIEDVIRIHRDHVRKGDTVWLMRDDKLVVLPVEIVFQDAEYAYLRGDLTAGDRVVITSLATVRDGAPLRLSQEGAPATIADG
jgi:RND family efflux transporter MFP subunit